VFFRGDADEIADLDLAKEIGETLHATYPGYLWGVNITGGVAIIRNYMISSKWGMVVHLKDILHDAGIRKRKIIQAGGEYLERAKLVRGMFDGSRPQTLDGDPDYEKKWFLPASMK
jgi:hypothetical protein